MSCGYNYHATGIYRSRNGWLFGVCRGLADYFDLSVFWLRLGVAVLVLLTGFWPGAVLYLAAALLMKLEPRYSDWRLG